VVCTSWKIVYTRFRELCEHGIILATLLSLSSVTTQAVLIRIQTLTLNNRRIILFSELHLEYPSDDKAQLEAFEQLILAREKADSHLTILVEQPLWQTMFPQLWDYRQVTTKIVDRFKDCPLKATSLLNIEVRFISYIANDLLEMDNPNDLHPKMICTYGNKSCALKDIKFQHIFEEFDELQERIEQARQEITPIWQKEAVSTAIDEAQVYRKKLEETIKHYKIHLGFKVLAIARYLHMSTQYPNEAVAKEAKEERREVSNSILNTFARLLDAHILVTAFKVSEGDVAIVAGRGHTDRIKSLLIMHMQPTTSIGYTSDYPPRLTAAQIKDTISPSQCPSFIRFFCCC